MFDYNMLYDYFITLVIINIFKVTADEVTYYMSENSQYCFCFATGSHGSF